MVELIDAPWAGVPARIRWHKRRWRCLEKTCQMVTFLEHDERARPPGAFGCCECNPRSDRADVRPRARLRGTWARRWAIRQLRVEGAAIWGLARQLGTTWNTV